VVAVVKLVFGQQAALELIDQCKNFSIRHSETSLILGYNKKRPPAKWLTGAISSSFESSGEFRRNQDLAFGESPTAI
jgi:hypothetical protein